jgi:ABC-2 type transport system permease protein
MINDLSTMIWKESRSLLRYQGRRSQLLISMAPPLLVAILLPWLMGMDWAYGYFPLFLSLVIAMVVNSLAVPDSFAGERERHTLETLLASRLPNLAILLAKMLISVIFSLGVTLFVLLLSLVTLNVFHWEGELIFYRLEVFIATLVFSLAIAVLVAALGVLISMRAPTVQEAQQKLFSILMLPPMLLGFLPMIFLALPDNPAAREIFGEILINFNADLAVWIIIGIFMMIDTGLLFLVVKRFKRARLVLD